MASWEIISRAHIWDEALFPSPVSVAKTLWQGIQDRSIVIATGVSLRRMLIGYGISLVFGAPLGFLIARVKWLDDTVGSLVLGMQTLPSICWLPLAILWFGLNDKAILFVVVTGSLLAITSAVKDGVRNIPPAYVRAAQTLGARPLAIYLEVLLPASLPVLLIAAKLGWSFAWRALFSGELLFVTLGLGHLLMMGRELGDMSQVIAVMVVIVALGLLTDSAIFGWLEARVRERWGFAPSN
jgi:NitT/TauT family transport system permease protein